MVSAVIGRGRAVAGGGGWRWGSLLVVPSDALAVLPLIGLLFIITSGALVVPPIN